MTITEFLEARIAEDEALAKATIADQQKRGWGDWREESLAEGGGLPAGALTAEYSPARVLAECAAKRAVVKSYLSCQHAENEARKDISRDVQKFGAKLVASGMVKGLELAVKYLAATYHTHPEYERDWADETIRSMRDHEVIPHYSDSGQEK